MISEKPVFHARKQKVLTNSEFIKNACTEDIFAAENARENTKKNTKTLCKENWQEKDQSAKQD